MTTQEIQNILNDPIFKEYDKYYSRIENRKYFVDEETRKWDTQRKSMSTQELLSYTIKNGGVYPDKKSILKYDEETESMRIKLKIQ